MPVERTQGFGHDLVEIALGMERGRLLLALESGGALHPAGLQLFRRVHGGARMDLGDVANVLRKARRGRELLHSPRVHGWRILQSPSASLGKATADLPVIELRRGYYAIESRDDPRKIREKVTGKVLTRAPALQKLRALTLI